MANWQLNYGINLKGGWPDKIQCKATDKGGNGLQLVMGGEIPDGPVSPEAAISKVIEAADGLDGLDAGDNSNHAKCLRAIAAFCSELADGIEN